MQNLDKFPRWHRYKVMFKSVTLFLGFASGVASTALMIQVYIVPFFSLLTYELGVVSSDIVSLSGKLQISSVFTSIANSSSTTTPIELGISSILLFASLVWLGSYQLGLFLNLRYSKMKWAKKVLLHLQALILCPVIGLVETFPAVYAIIEYNINRKQATEKISVYDFYIITK